MKSTIISTTADSISSGGTITGDLTISGDLSVEGGGSFTYDEMLTGDIIIDKNFTGTTTATTKGLFVDFDATGITASGQTATNIGLDLDMNSDSPTMVGTVVNTGIDIDLTAATSGVQTNVGLDVAVSGADTNYAALFNGGNVGIGYATGLTAPTSLLHVYADGDDWDNSEPIASIVNINATGSESNGLKIQAGDDGANAYALSVLNKSGSTMMEVQGDGNVGIGNAAPGASLEVSKSAGSCTVEISSWSTTDAHNPKLTFQKSGNATVNSFTATADDEDIGEILFAGVNTAPASVDCAYIIVKQDGSAGGTYIGADMAFQIGTNAAAPTTKLLLDNNSRISLSNNDSGGTGGSDSTTGNTLFGYLAGEDISSGGHNNTLLGHGSGKNITKGNHNVSIGTGAMDAMVGHADNSGGLRNIAIGVDAMGALDVGTHADATIQHNIAIGVDALKGAQFSGDTDMKGCIALGNYALDATGTNSQTGIVAIGHQALTQLSQSTGCTAVGYQSGYSNTGSGMNNNTHLGYNTGWYTQGSDNTYVGYFAGKGAAGSDSYNVGVGSGALSALATGGYNTSVGYQAGLAITKGRYNTAIGSQSLLAETVGDRSTAVGYQALYSQIIGGGDNQVSGNTGIGMYAGLYNVTGQNNTYLGYNAGAGASGQSNSGNTAVGKDAMLSVRDGSYNCAMGEMALDSLTDGLRNVAIGYGSLITSTSAIDCVAIGKDAMADGNVTSAAVGSIAIGQSALKALTSGAGSIAIGYQALNTHTEGSRNMAIGYGAMNETNATAAADGGAGGTPGTLASVDNIFIGYDSGGGTWAGSDSNSNVAIGNYSMDAAMDGANDNTAVGHNALTGVTSGNNNTALGSTTLSACITGSENTAVGKNALANHNSTTATAVGYGALTSANSANNTAVGFQALYHQSSGADNVAMGRRAGRYYGASTSALATATDCIYIGDLARANADSMTNEIVIGADAIGGGSNTVTLGNDSVTDVYMASDSGATVHAAGIKFDASGEVLGDYEEGTWTPTLWDDDSEFSSYVVQDGFYTKIGNRVYCGGAVTTDGNSGITGANAIRMFGLPFNSSSTANAYSGGGINYAYGLAITAGNTVGIRVELNNTLCYLPIWSATTGTPGMTCDEWSVDGSIRFHFSYQAAT